MTISGKTYNVEGVDAFNALSSSGSLRYGDTITVLLGRTGDVAGVMTENDTTAQYGYVISSGRKDFTNPDGTLYSSYYVRMVTPDGVENEYTIKNDGKDYVGTVCSVSFNNDGARLSMLKSSGGLSGKVNGSNFTIGSARLANNINILDTALKTSPNSPILYKRIYPQRLDGINLRSGNILYYQKNSSGEITDMILQDITGDMYSYGIITSRSNNGMSDVYSLDIDGTAYTYTPENKVYLSTPYKVFTDGVSIINVGDLPKYSGTSSNLTPTSVTVGGKTYLLSDKVVVYKKSGSTYMKIPLTEAIENKYRVSAYYDRPEASGGRVRILMAD